MPARTKPPAKPARTREPAATKPVDPGVPWLTIEVDQAALAANMGLFRRLVGARTRLLAVVKADAYGHGLLLAAPAFLAGGADILGVHSAAELVRLRAGGIQAPVLILGPLTAAETKIAADLGAEATVASLAAAAALREASLPAGVPLPLHLKVETGVNRQGLTEAEIPAALEILRALPGVRLAGLSSHFADIEDTTDHAFARRQMERFEGYRRLLAAAGHADLQAHMSCSASTLLWDSSHRDLARVGIAAYGIWPSRETLVSVREGGRPVADLKPALRWTVRVSQVREVPAGETVGYGRTWKAMTPSRIAVLPVGYADGWPRALSGRGHVLIAGRRAPLVGRICMNLCMADVTHVPEAAAGSAAVLLGRQGDEAISPEMLAGLLGTIAYEVVTLPKETWTRVPV